MISNQTLFKSVTICLIWFFFTPDTLRAATYLVGIPGIAEGQDYTLTAVVNALYLVAISIAGLLAVVKIVLAGAKYMLTDIVSTKQDARNDIQGALFGLLLILASALILYTINPNLARLELQAPPLARLPRPNTTLGTSYGVDTSGFGVGDSIPTDGLSSTEYDEIVNSCQNDQGQIILLRSGPGGETMSCIPQLADPTFDPTSVASGFNAQLPQRDDEILATLRQIDRLIGGQIGKEVSDNPDRLIGAVYVSDENIDPVVYSQQLTQRCLESSRNGAGGTDVYYVELTNPDGSSASSGGTFFCLNTT